jgi:hypothetical protein
MRSAIYTGTLMHARRSPRRNVFRYPVSYWLLDLDELPELERRLGPVAVNRRGLVTFRDSDHFDGSPVKQAVIDFTGDPSVERVLMLTQLRVLGYVFNPVSFYWCYRRAPGGNGRSAAGTEDHLGEERAGGEWELACMVAELGNTFGERLPELLRGPSLRYAHEKRLHVSPFFGLDQSYEYAFSQPGDEVWARIHVHDADGGTPLTAVLHGHRQELSNASVIRTLLRYPLQPLQVIGLIHWQALRLLLKRVPFHHKPPFVPGQGSHMSALTVSPPTEQAQQSPRPAREALAGEALPLKDVAG